MNARFVCGERITASLSCVGNFQQYHGDNRGRKLSVRSPHAKNVYEFYQPHPAGLASSV